jgi:hypothetical protein
VSREEPDDELLDDDFDAPWEPDFAPLLVSFESEVFIIICILNDLIIQR